MSRWSDAEVDDWYTGCACFELCMSLGETRRSWRQRTKAVSSNSAGS